MSKESNLATQRGGGYSPACIPVLHPITTQDSNLDRQVQSLTCCRYTSGESLTRELNPLLDVGNVTSYRLTRGAWLLQ
jgi:hypothetical protein